MTKLKEKYGPWTLITGASSGLGAACANRLAAEGVNLVLVARREDRLSALAEELERTASIKARVVSADLSRDDFLPRITEATEGLEINLLVNNAGHGLTADFLASDLESELGVFHLNSRAPLILTHHYGRLMQRRGRGGIIFLASVVGLTGVASWSNYAATKGHNLLFAEGLAEELKRDGVDVLAVAPAFIRTGLIKLSSFGRMMSLEPKNVVEVALASLGKKRVVTPGLLHKLIAFSTRLQPRVLNTKIFGAVVSRADGSQSSAPAASRPKRGAVV